MGNARNYQYACALRAVTSNDNMTAAASDLSGELLDEVATRIVNQLTASTACCTISSADCLGLSRGIILESV